MRQALKVHPDSLCSAVTHIEVEIMRPCSGSLVLSYLVTGRIGDLGIPAGSCGSAYRWALAAHVFRGIRPHFARPRLLRIQLCALNTMGAYRFDSYRSGMRVATEIGAPRIEVQSSRTCYKLQASLEMDQMSSLRIDGGMANWFRGGDRRYERP